MLPLISSSSDVTFFRQTFIIFGIVNLLILVFATEPTKAFWLTDGSLLVKQPVAVEQLKENDIAPLASFNAVSVDKQPASTLQSIDKLNSERNNTINSDLLSLKLADSFPSSSRSLSSEFRKGSEQETNERSPNEPSSSNSPVGDNQQQQQQQQQQHEQANSFVTQAPACQCSPDWLQNQTNFWLGKWLESSTLADQVRVGLLLAPPTAGPSNGQNINGFSRLGLAWSKHTPASKRGSGSGTNRDLASKQHAPPQGQAPHQLQSSSSSAALGRNWQQRRSNARHGARGASGPNQGRRELKLVPGERGPKGEPGARGERGPSGLISVKDRGSLFDLDSATGPTGEQQLHSSAVAQQLVSLNLGKISSAKSAAATTNIDPNTSAAASPRLVFVESEQLLVVETVSGWRPIPMLAPLHDFRKTIAKFSLISEEQRNKLMGNEQKGASGGSVSKMDEEEEDDDDDNEDDDETEDGNDGDENSIHGSLAKDSGANSIFSPTIKNRPTAGSAILRQPVLMSTAPTKSSIRNKAHRSRQSSSTERLTPNENSINAGKIVNGAANEDEDDEEDDNEDDEDNFVDGSDDDAALDKKGATGSNDAAGQSSSSIRQKDAAETQSRKLNLPSSDTNRDTSRKGTQITGRSALASLREIVLVDASPESNSISNSARSQLGLDSDDGSLVDTPRQLQNSLLPKAPPKATKFRLIALNEPFSGNQHGLRGANLECKRNAARAGIRSAFRALLATNYQNLNEIIRQTSHVQNSPIINIRGEVLANSWLDLFKSPARAPNPMSRIYSFDGRHVAGDPNWPNKLIWLGTSSKFGHRDSTTHNCDGWHSDSLNKHGFASPLHMPRGARHNGHLHSPLRNYHHHLNENRLQPHKRFAGESQASGANATSLVFDAIEKYPCRMPLIVLCIETIAQVI